MSNERPILAICYDFDKTLSPDNMQASGYIQSVGWDVDDFWRESSKLAREHRMDANLAYMYLMAREARGRIVFTREALRRYGEEVALYPGVTEWFDLLAEIGERAGVTIEHYVISSGLAEMIAGTAIAARFTAVFASAFAYDEYGVAVWPAQAVNYTNKTQFLYRIKKGIPDITDERVNDPVAEDEVRVPFHRMVYLGDSATDIPCMKLVNREGGFAVGVYDPESGDRRQVDRLLREGRIGYAAPADYRRGGELAVLLEQIVQQVASAARLEAEHRHQMRLAQKTSE